MEEKKTETPKPQQKPATPTSKPAPTQQPKAKVEQRKR